MPVTILCQLGSVPCTKAGLPPDQSVDGSRINVILFQDISYTLLHIGLGACSRQPFQASPDGGGEAIEVCSEAEVEQDLLSGLVLNEERPGRCIKKVVAVDLVTVEDRYRNTHMCCTVDDLDPNRVGRRGNYVGHGEGLFAVKNVQAVGVARWSDASSTKKRTAKPEPTILFIHERCRQEFCQELNGQYCRCVDRM